MKLKRRFQSRKKGIVFVLIWAAAMLSTGSIFAAEQQDTPAIARYRVFTPKIISAQQARQYLDQLRIGTVSQLPGANTLLVTALPNDLIKATAILKLVDSHQQFVIKPISEASEAERLPPNIKIAKKIGNISIGTFLEPPAGDTAQKAIIDIHDKTVIAIAPADTIEKIFSIIEKRDIEPDKKVESLPPTRKPAVETSDKLLDMIAEAERMEAGLKALDRQRKTLPETKAKLRKSKPATVEQLKQPSLPAVVEDTKTVFEAPQAEPKLETTSEQPYEADETSDVRWSYEPEPVEIADEMLDLDLPEKLNIIDLLDLVGKYLNLDYMFDPAKVKGEVTLKVQGPIKVKNLYPLLESVLKFRGFVMARRGNLVTIVPAGEVLDIDPTLLYTEESKIQYGDAIVTRFFDLRFIDTVSAKNLLNGMKLGVNITPIAETGTLIVTGYTYRMARIEQLLEVVDKPGEPKQFRFRQLKYTMASTLAPKIKTLAEELGTISVSIAAPSRPAPKPKRGRRRTPAKKPAPKPTAAVKPTVYLDADERTNRILMIGLEEQLVVVDDLIDTLDVQQQDLRTLRLYEIQHVGAEEVRGKLTELGIIGVGGRPTTSRTARAKTAKPTPKPAATTSAAGGALAEEPQVVIIEATNSLLVNATAEQHAQIAMIIGYVDSETLKQAIPYVIYALENQDPEDLADILERLIQETIKDKEGKIQKTVKKIEEDIVIVPDKNTFSIIVYASRKNQEWIKRLIKTLDKRRPQVLIDVTLVEVSRADEFTYDLQLIGASPDLTKTSGAGIIDGPGAITNTVQSNLASAARDYFAEFSSIGGFGTGFYADRHIEALLTAIETKQYGRVLSKPKILVNDGQPGTIKTTDTTNVAIETTIIPDQGTSQTATDFREYTAGLNLTITPNISEGDLLLLEIELTRSDFLPTADSTVPPDRTETNINTVVTVPDGRTIILGGLTTLTQTKGGSKIPLLGDIPLIGGLFRSTANTDDAGKLYIFVKANILRPDETLAGLPELEKISKRNRVAFEEFEKRFQEHEDWPGIKPEPMDPLRVLEAE